MQVKYEITLPAEEKVAYIELREDLNYGQRIENFRILCGSKCVCQAYTVGHKKICAVNAAGSHFTIYVTGARDEVVMRDITLYSA